MKSQVMTIGKIAVGNSHPKKRKATKTTCLSTAMSYQTQKRKSHQSSTFDYNLQWTENAKTCQSNYVDSAAIANSMPLHMHVL